MANGRISIALLFASTIAARPSHAQTSPPATVVLDAPGAAIEPATLLDVARPAIRVFRDRDGLPENAIMSIARDGRGDLVVGTQDGVATFDGHGWSTLALPNREISNFVRGIHVDDAGRSGVAGKTAASRVSTEARGPPSMSHRGCRAVA